MQELTVKIRMEKNCDDLMPGKAHSDDAGYRGEVGVVLFNFGKEDFIIKRGDRIAQMVFARLPETELVPVTELSATNRGEGGFGSTGKK